MLRHSVGRISAAQSDKFGVRGSARRVSDVGLRCANPTYAPAGLPQAGVISARQYGSMIVACRVYPASPTSFRCASVRISPVTHTGSNSSCSG